LIYLEDFIYVNESHFVYNILDSYWDPAELARLTPDELVPLSQARSHWGITWGDFCILKVSPVFIPAPVLSFPVKFYFTTPAPVLSMPLSFSVLLPLSRASGSQPFRFGISEFVSLVWRNLPGQSPRLFSDVISIPVRASWGPICFLSSPGLQSVEVSPPTSCPFSRYLDCLCPVRFLRLDGFLPSVEPLNVFFCTISRSYWPPFLLAPPSFCPSAPGSPLSLVASGLSFWLPPDDRALFPWSPDPPWACGFERIFSGWVASLLLAGQVVGLCCWGDWVVEGSSCGSKIYFSRVPFSLPLSWHCFVVSWLVVGYVVHLFGFVGLFLSPLCWVVAPFWLLLGCVRDLGGVWLMGCFGLAVVNFVFRESWCCCLLHLSPFLCVSFVGVVGCFPL